MRVRVAVNNDPDILARVQAAVDDAEAGARDVHAALPGARNDAQAALGLARAALARAETAGTPAEAQEAVDDAEAAIRAATAATASIGAMDLVFRAAETNSMALAQVEYNQALRKFAEAQRSNDRAKFSAVAMDFWNAYQHMTAAKRLELTGARDFTRKILISYREAARRAGEYSNSEYANELLGRL
jgi:hypothetical protein